VPELPELSDSVLHWQIATVESVVVASPRVKLFRLSLGASQKFRAGQHYDIRLTAPDGYQAQRSYSVSSSPEDVRSLELAIELIDEGEVSSYFHEAVEPGEMIELRGPIGGYFTWAKNFLEPVILIAGGSGIAPIMAMLRARANQESRGPCLLMFSVRNYDDILFREELEQMANEDPMIKLAITLTREIPSDWNGSTGRIDREMIDNAITRMGIRPQRAYICGGSTFVESIATNLVDSGLNFNEIRTERFGP